MGRGGTCGFLRAFQPIQTSSEECESGFRFAMLFWHVINPRDTFSSGRFATGSSAFSTCWRNVVLWATRVLNMTFEAPSSTQIE